MAHSSPPVQKISAVLLDLLDVETELCFFQKVVEPSLESRFFESFQSADPQMLHLSDGFQPLCFRW